MCGTFKELNHESDIDLMRLSEWGSDYFVALHDWSGLDELTVLGPAKITG